MEELKDDKCVANCLKQLERALSWHLSPDMANFKMEQIKKIVYG